MNDGKPVEASTVLMQRTASVESDPRPDGTILSEGRHR